jgi:hypothetical protein
MAKARSARGGRKGKTAKKSKGGKAKARKPQGARRPAGKARARKTPGRKAAARKAATRKTAARKSSKPAKKAAARRPQGRKAAARKPAAKPVRKAAPQRKPAPKPAKAAKPRAAGPHQRAANRAAEAAARKAPALNRERRRLAESDEELMPSAPSTLGYEGGSSAARSGRSELRDSLAQHTETGPAMTGGDVDASWEDAYAVGDEAPGGDNPTPDQDIVDEIGKALGVQYDDNEELKGADKIQERDRHRWELDPASSDDYIDRAKDND